MSKYDELVENKALKVRNLDGRVRRLTRKGTNWRSFDVFPSRFYPDERHAYLESAKFVKFI